MNPDKLEGPHLQRRVGEGNSRREMLHAAGVAGALTCLLSWRPRLLYAQSPQGDLAILTAALYLEHEAIAAYQAGAGSKLLSPGVLKVAIAFQSDHKHHRDGIVGVIRVLGAEPAGPEAKYEFGRLRSEKDVLRLARDLENGAVRAYGTLASNIQNRTALNFGANVLVDEVRHRTVLNAALGIPNY